MQFRCLILASLLVLGTVSADVYMHNPRGSNNRLNEKSADRTNGDRLFDSQNNNRGGYNVGDRTDDAFSANAPFYPTDVTFDADVQKTTTASQYQMMYFEGSQLSVEWTNQHGCGGNEANDPHKQNCDIIIQYMCQTSDDGTKSPNAPSHSGAEDLRDGSNTNTPSEPNSATDVTTTATSNRGTTPNLGNSKGRHESEAYYYECKLRSRNKGLFTADQVLNGDTAKYTRQNPNGNRRGLECPEERDYYPYWSPTPWKDVAVLTDHPDKWCDADGKYNGASQNNNPVYKCVSEDYTNTKAWKAITQASCMAAGGS